MKQIFKRSFRPDRKRLMLFAIFMFIVYAGNIQVWGFTDADVIDIGLPKPALYDLLKPIPFWPIWIYLSLPLFVLLPGLFSYSSGPLACVALGIQSIYFYTLACLLIVTVGSIWDTLISLIRG